MFSYCDSQISEEAKSSIKEKRKRGKQETHLRGHPERAALDPRLGQRLRLTDLLGQPEIRQHHPPLVVPQNVGALYVPACSKMIRSE
jgi:hypothetical protein